MPHRRSDSPTYQDYFVGRLLEALARADHAENALERSTHLRACRYYRQLLAAWHGMAMPALPDEGDANIGACAKRG